LPAIDVRSTIPLGGFIEDWLRLTEPFEYPYSYGLFALLTMASCAVDGRIDINPDHEPNPKPNLYTILYGPSGFGKSTALWHGVDMLGKAMPDAPVLPETFTMESLVGLLAEKSKQPDEEHPERMGRAPGLIIAEEMSTLLGGADYRLENSKALSKLYDCRPVTRNLTRAHGDEVIKKPYIVLGGCSTPEWIESLDPRALTGGLWRRILMVSEWMPKCEASKPKLNSVLMNRLAAIFASRFSLERIPASFMRLDEEAEKVNDTWYHSILRKRRAAVRTEREGFFVKSLQTHIYKVGALVHLLEGGKPDVLPAAALVSGQKIIDSILPGTFQAYASLVPGPFARLKAVVVRQMLAQPGKILGIKLDSLVTQDTGARRRDAVEARNNLIDEGVLSHDEAGWVDMERGGSDAVHTSEPTG